MGRLSQPVEKVELGRCQVHRVAGARHAPARRVDRQGAEPDRDSGVARDGASRPAQEGSHAGDELARAERLRHVVVAPDREPDFEIRLGIPRREHEDGHRPVALDPAADVETVEPGKHQVEDDEIRAIALAQRDAADAVGGDLHLEPLRLEPRRDRARDRRLVLDHRDPLTLHRRLSVSRVRREAARKLWRSRAGPDCHLLGIG
jgi:hypothetical protein